MGRATVTLLIVFVCVALRAAAQERTSGSPEAPAPASLPVTSTRVLPLRDPSDAIAARIRAALKARVPSLAVAEIHSTQIPGLYEVLSPDGVTYTDAAADYVIMGELLETKTRRNITRERWEAFGHIDFASLPFSLAIRSTRGTGERQLAVFADPQCPYCQELEAELAKLDNITVYTFLYPLEDVHPGATTRARQIWCAADRETAWLSWMRKREALATSPCAGDPLHELAGLGEKLHIQATPTIFFSSGRRFSGLPSAQEFEHLLERESPPTATAIARDASHSPQ